MSEVTKAEGREVERTDVFDRLDRMFEDWTNLMPWRRKGLLTRDWPAEEAIKVDEFREDGQLVVRAELAGIDPEKDVELTVSDGLLHIHAQRREERETQDKGYVRREMRYGSFSRTLPLPAGATGSDVTATYKDGILEVHVPMPKSEAVSKVPVTRS